jgi:hypothetical protein
VNVSSFGRLFSVAVDSTVYSLPLYVPGLTMSDGFVHNVLFVATENDSIYAFDADSNGGANANPILKRLNIAAGSKRKIDDRRRSQKAADRPEPGRCRRSSRGGIRVPQA